MSCLDLSTLSLLLCIWLGTAVPIVLGPLAVTPWIGSLFNIGLPRVTRIKIVLLFFSIDIPGNLPRSALGVLVTSGLGDAGIWQFLPIKLNK
jgi:hypothetical protein